MNPTTATQLRPFAALRLAVDGLRDESIVDLPGAALGDQLIELGVLAARLAHESARRAVAFDASGGSLGDGFPSGAAWLRSNTVVSPAHAADLVRVGRALRDRLPATQAALRAGRFGFEAAVGIVRASRDVRDADVLAALDSTLSDIAPTLAPSQVPHAARRILEHLDPELLQRDAAQRHADRSLTLSPLLDGAVSVHGQLDEEGAAVLLSALAPMTTPRGAEDNGTAAQRRADALVELVAKAAEAGAAGQLTGTGLPPTLIVRVDVATLAGLGAPGLVLRRWSDCSGLLAGAAGGAAAGRAGLGRPDPEAGPGADRLRCADRPPRDRGAVAGSGPWPGAAFRQPSAEARHRHAAQRLQLSGLRSTARVDRHPSRAAVGAGRRDRSGRSAELLSLPPSTLP